MISQDQGALVDEVGEVALVNLELHGVRLRDVIRCYLDPSTQMAEAVDCCDRDTQLGFEWVECRSRGVPSEQLLALPGEPLDVRSHQDGALSPDACPGCTAMNRHAKPVAVVVVDRVRKLPAMDPQPETSDSQSGVPKVLRGWSLHPLCV